MFKYMFVCIRFLMGSLTLVVPQKKITCVDDPDFFTEILYSTCTDWHSSDCSTGLIGGIVFTEHPAWLQANCPISCRTGCLGCSNAPNVATNQFDAWTIKGNWLDPFSSAAPSCPEHTTCGNENNFRDGKNYPYKRSWDCDLGEDGPLYCDSCFTDEDECESPPGCEYFMRPEGSHCNYKPAIENCPVACPLGPQYLTTSTTEGGASGVRIISGWLDYPDAPMAPEPARWHTLADGTQCPAVEAWVGTADMGTAFKEEGPTSTYLCHRWGFMVHYEDSDDPDFDLLGDDTVSFNDNGYSLCTSDTMGDPIGEVSASGYMMVKTLCDRDCNSATPFDIRLASFQVYYENHASISPWKYGWHAGALIKYCGVKYHLADVGWMCGQYPPGDDAFNAYSAPVEGDWIYVYPKRDSDFWDNAKWRADYREQVVGSLIYCQQAYPTAATDLAGPKPGQYSVGYHTIPHKSPMFTFIEEEEEEEEEVIGITATTNMQYFDGSASASPYDCNDYTAFGALPDPYGNYDCLLSCPSSLPPSKLGFGEPFMTGRVNWGVFSYHWGDGHCDYFLNCPLYGCDGGDCMGIMGAKYQCDIATDPTFISRLFLKKRDPVGNPKGIVMSTTPVQVLQNVETWTENGVPHETWRVKREQKAGFGLESQEYDETYFRYDENTVWSEIGYDPRNVSSNSSDTEIETGGIPFDMVKSDCMAGVEYEWQHSNPMLTNLLHSLLYDIPRNDPTNLVFLHNHEDLNKVILPLTDTSFESSLLDGWSLMPRGHTSSVHRAEKCDSPESSKMMHWVTTGDTLKLPIGIKFGSGGFISCEDCRATETKTTCAEGDTGNCRCYDDPFKQNIKCKEEVGEGGGTEIAQDEGAPTEMEISCNSGDRCAYLSLGDIFYQEVSIKVDGLLSSNATEVVFKNGLIEFSAWMHMVGQIKPGSFFSMIIAQYDTDQTEVHFKENRFNARDFPTDGSWKEFKIKAAAMNGLQTIRVGFTGPVAVDGALIGIDDISLAVLAEDDMDKFSFEHNCNHACRACPDMDLCAPCVPALVGIKELWCPFDCHCEDDRSKIDSSCNPNPGMLRDCMGTELTERAELERLGDGICDTFLCDSQGNCDTNFNCLEWGCDHMDCAIGGHLVELNQCEANVNDIGLATGNAYGDEATTTTCDPWGDKNCRKDLDANSGAFRLSPLGVVCFAVLGFISVLRHS